MSNPFLPFLTLEALAMAGLTQKQVLYDFSQTESALQETQARAGKESWDYQHVYTKLIRLWCTLKLTRHPREFFPESVLPEHT